MTEVDPHWRFNTSKKISLLTKVVFRLHSNSMDHRDSAVELKERYEDEITEILEEGKNWLENAQKQTESFHPTIESVVHNEFEMKFDQTRQQLETPKQKRLSQPENLIKNATLQLEAIRSQIDSIKQKAEDDQKEFTEIINTINQLCEKSASVMEGNRSKAIARLVAEANAKYEATLQITQKKEQEMREKYENEIEELKKTLESSKISAEDTLTQNLKKFEESIEQLTKDNLELSQLVKQFSEKSEEHKTDVQKVFKIAESFRDKILENQQKDLINFQAQLQKLKTDHEADVKQIKDIIKSEESLFNQAYQQKVSEYNKYDQIFQQKASEYEELAKKATAEAELKNQQLVKEHNETLEKFEKAKIQFIEKEHEKSHLINQKILDIQKEHQKKVSAIRDQIENQLNEYLQSSEKVRNDHQAEILKMKEDSKEKITKRQKNLFEINKDSTSEIQSIFGQMSKLQNSLELSKYEFQRDMQSLDDSKNREMTIIQREHEAKMSYFDHTFDHEVKEIDDKHNSLFEKEKKQYSIDLKFAIERSNIDIKHSLDRKRNEIDTKRMEELEADRDKNDRELSILSQEIECKTIDKKALDIRLQNDLADYNSKLSEMQKEVKLMESNWIEEKQKYKTAWSEKFEKIKGQLTEEEKQNEDMRKYDESKCQQILDKLKAELQEEEENGAKNLADMKKLIEEEKIKGEGEINRLKGEIEKLSSNREGSVSDLEKKLDSLKADRENRLKESNEKKIQEIENHNKKLQDLRKSYQVETCDLKNELVEKSHDHEKEVLDLKIKLEQSQLDFSFLVDEFERKKNLELEMIANKNQYELEMLAIELVKLQNEADRISSEDSKNIESLKNLEKKCSERLDKEASFIREKTEKENRKKIEEKEKFISELHSNLNETEAGNKKLPPRQKDIEHIACLEEVLNERAEAAEMLDDVTKRYEAFFIEHELHFLQLKEGKQAPKIQDMPTIVAPVTQSGSKKLKRDKMSALFSSQRKVPAIKDYSASNRKNKVLV